MFKKIVVVKKINEDPYNREKRENVFLFFTLDELYFIFL